jgi:hypothetical protein
VSTELPNLLTVLKSGEVKTDRYGTRWVINGVREDRIYVTSEAGMQKEMTAYECMLENWLPSWDAVKRRAQDWGYVWKDDVDADS